ncbi:MAG TPA: DUF2868 domain-containing protein [Burkholderiaceae bacterium]|nr:DUF2868 domain-containing protein [Burkholderiaceae bacterium]
MPGSPSPLDEYWLAETLRLRESLWGPLQDAMEVRQARTQADGFTRKVLLRARLIARREQLDVLIQRWKQGARLALAGMWLLAILAGAGAALGALGDGSRAVNLLLALAGLLGLNLLSFLFWLASFAVGNHGGGALLGELWLWLTRKLARGPDAALAPRALIELLGRNKALRWLLGAISHGLWASALIAMLLTLVGLLSARRYGFQWETTLLSPDDFVWMTAVLGWLPAKLGFAIPSEAIVRASSGLVAMPEAGRGLWSSWLIGCVVTYGLLPRLAALAVTFWMSRRHLAAMTLDESLPGYAELRDRLTPSSEQAGIDAPDTDAFQARIQPRIGQPLLPGQILAVGLELPPDMSWPPAALPDTVADLGVVDTRAQRHALLDRLQGHAGARLLLACDGRQTPDRGTIALLADLASLAARSAVLVLDGAPDDTARRNRRQSWEQRLSAAGFSNEQIHTDLSMAMASLAGPEGERPAKERHAVR